MSTHDYVVDNQSAVAFRADLNAALAAIVTQNSSATAPVTTFANMIWYDTATNILKKRNEANSAWISLGTIDETAGTFTPTGGTVAIASQAEAEAGTDNTKMMTPLRAAQAIAALASFTPTTAQVLTATAGLTAGDIGTHMLATNSGTTSATLPAGTVVSGSSLTPSASSGATRTGTMAGSWRSLGAHLTGPTGGGTPIGLDDPRRITLFVRIS